MKELLLAAAKPRAPRTHMLATVRMPPPHIHPLGYSCVHALPCRVLAHPSMLSRLRLVVALALDLLRRVALAQSSSARHAVPPRGCHMFFLVVLPLLRHAFVGHTTSRLCPTAALSLCSCSTHSATPSSAPSCRAFALDIVPSCVASSTGHHALTSVGCSLVARRS